MGGIGLSVVGVKFPVPDIMATLQLWIVYVGNLGDFFP